MKSETIDDAQSNPEGGSIPPHTGFIPDVPPEIGVSTKYTLAGTDYPTATFHKKEKQHWYALRATYGRAKQSYEYLTEQGIEAYHPTIRVYRMIDGKRRKIEESRLPNIFFARSTENILKTYVYDNVNLPHLRFYYSHYGIGDEARKEPLIVPDVQMESLKIICRNEDSDYLLLPHSDERFEKGDTVMVTGGDFKGVIGKVARYCGQLRVGVIIDGLLTIATAYVPRGYLKKIDP